MSAHQRFSFLFHNSLSSSGNLFHGYLLNSYVFSLLYLCYFHLFIDAFLLFSFGLSSTEMQIENKRLKVKGLKEKIKKRDP